MSQKYRKRNFYKSSLDDPEKDEIESASLVDGIDDEIAVTRVLLKSLVRAKPPDINGILHTLALLVRMVETRYKLTGNRDQKLQAELNQYLSDFTLPMGISKLHKKPE